MESSIISRSKYVFYVLSLLTTLTISCAPTGKESFKVNLGIPVRSQKPYEFEKKFFTLTQHIQNPVCRQNQILLVMKNETSGQIYSTQKVKLITEVPQNTPFTYNPDSPDLDLVIQWLMQNSELEEEPVLLKPINQNAVVQLIGAFFKPLNLNSQNNSACDAFDFDPTKKNYYFSRETPLEPVSLSNNDYSGLTGHTATKLNNGKILVVGGVTMVTPDGKRTSTAKTRIYDPNQRSWSWAKPLSNPRAFHTATILPNGKVVVMGGAQYTANESSISTVSLKSVEIYDPVQDQWTLIPNGLNTARYHHTASLIEGGNQNGKILVVGGAKQLNQSFQLLNSYELFDPNTLSTTPTSSPIYQNEPGFYKHTATRLFNNKIFFFGGIKDSATGSNIPTATNHYFVYDPDSNSFTQPTYTQNASPSSGHTATLVGTKVIITGGLNDYGSPTNQILIYDETIGMALSNSVLLYARHGHTATLLPSGKVLISGGENSDYEFVRENEFVEMDDSGTINVTLIDSANNPELILYSELKDRTATLVDDMNEKVVFIGGNSFGSSNNDLQNPEFIPHSEVDHFDFRRPATSLTSLSGSGMIDEKAKSSGIVQLNIGVLHGNPNSDYDTSSNPTRFQDWVGIPSYGTNPFPGSSFTETKLAQITIPPLSADYESIAFAINNETTASKYYVPRFFPMQLEFRYRSPYIFSPVNVCEQPAMVGCHGRYKTTINGTGNLILQFERMPFFSSKGNPPPVNFSIPFSVESYSP
jgi:N-acetylneuraminic acid mutarotase